MLPNWHGAQPEVERIMLHRERQGERVEEHISGYYGLLSDYLRRMVA